MRRVFAAGMLIMLILLLFRFTAPSSPSVAVGYYWLPQIVMVSPTTVPTTKKGTTPVAMSQPVTTTGNDYVSIARQAARAARLDEAVFVAQIRQESGFQPHVVSSAGAIGIAQFMPSTARGLGLDPWDPVASLYAAARLMASYVARYHGSYAAALAAYNAGPGTVNWCITQYGAAWQSCLPYETRNYITAILG